MIRLKFDSNHDILQGTIALPASKSISNRALLLHALCPAKQTEGESGSVKEEIRNLALCDDTRVMQKALEQASALLSDKESEKEGSDSLSFVKKENKALNINVEGAGTAMRFLTAYFACQKGVDVVLTGNGRMQQRPIALLVDALRTLGADITYLKGEGCPPLLIRGKKLRGDRLTIDGSVSSQYVSALMMIAPHVSPEADADVPFRLSLLGKIASRPYIKMTQALMSHYGIEAQWDGDDTLLIPRGSYRARPLTVEGDWSAASYWLAMKALAQKFHIPCNIELQGLSESSIQGDSICAELLDAQKIAQGEIDIDCSNCPDLIQTLAVTYFLLDVPFRIRGAESLRIKETDRIEALIAELRKLGCELKTESRLQNGHEEQILVWDGTRNDADEKSACISTYGDHRMAMSFAPAVLRFGQIDIEHPEVVSKSYPSFWEDLAQIGIQIRPLGNAPRVSSEGRKL
ncbi:MAG: 3-phosphoshikimate 1-carboxyvinyltransferase [Bacteroidaceae bacterium]|nr:3-phosphoshikimate 1-carboxyvinyltransferase [Bacteroidaceae bacterium]